MYKSFLSVKFWTLFFYYINFFQKNQGLKRLSVKLFFEKVWHLENLWHLEKVWHLGKVWHIEKVWHLVILSLDFFENFLCSKKIESKTWHLEKIYTWTRLLYSIWEGAQKVFPFEKVEYFPTFWFEKALRRFSFWEGLEKHGTITE